MFISITTFIAIFKKEKDCTIEHNYVKLNVFQYYSLLWKVLKLPNMKILAVVLLTVKVSAITSKVKRVYFIVWPLIFDFYHYPIIINYLLLGTIDIRVKFLFSSNAR